MAAQEFVITDLEQDIWHESLQILPDEKLQLSGSNSWSVSAKTLKAGVSAGVQVLDLNNGAFDISILPTRGMGVWKANYQGIPVQWESPVKYPVHPAFVDLHDRNGIGWLSGFNELICRCGLAFNGPPGDDEGQQLTLHGKIANLPAHQLSCSIDPEDAGTITVTGVVDEATMFGSCLRLESELSTVAGSNSFTIRDTVTNLSDQPAELELLYHTNIGRPFLGKNSRFAVAVREVAPRDERAAEGIDSWMTYDDAEIGYAEQVYFLHPASDLNGQSLVMLHTEDREVGLSLRYQQSQLPCFALWKNTQGERDGFCTGLEPATNFPNFKSFEREQGRVIELPPGESYETGFTLTVHDSQASVEETLQEITRIQGEVTCEIRRQPGLPYCPE